MVDDSMNEQITIAVVGSGYVGLVAAVCFAEIGHRVICVDNDESKIAMLRDGKVPIYEEYLPARSSALKESNRMACPL